MEHRKTTIMLAIGLAAVSLMATATGQGDADREQSYVGFGDHNNAPLVWSCDLEENGGNGPHGVGGVVFCGVPKGAVATIVVDDAVSADASFRVSCLADVQGTHLPPEPLPAAVTYTAYDFENLLEAVNTVTFDVPQACHQSLHDDAPAGHTDIAVLPEGSPSGTVRLITP